MADRDRETLKQALIVAEYETDESDSMTDYFATKNQATVPLAWSKHTRDLFREMLEAAEQEVKRLRKVRGVHALMLERWCDALESLSMEEVGVHVRSMLIENERLRRRIEGGKEQVRMDKNLLKARIEAALAIIKNYLSTPGCPAMLASFAMKLRSALKGEGE